MSDKDMIVMILKYAEAQVGTVGNIYAGLMAEESIGINGPVGFRIGKAGLIKSVGRKGSDDIMIELLLIHDYGCVENWFN